jgi:glutaconate CoA-transferase subunit A
MDPHFRAARQTGAIDDEPYDEGLFHLGLLAASWRVPFLPARAGLGSDLFRDNDRLRTVTSPYDDQEELVAAPAFELDAAICHLNRADRRGNAMFLGPDLFWDDVMLSAAPTGKRFVSTERIVQTDELLGEGCVHQLRIPRMSVDAVIEAPLGAHFTSCDPDYPRDEEFQREYVESAASPEAWSEFRASWIDIAEADYVERVTRRFDR